MKSWCLVLIAAAFTVMTLASGCGGGKKDPYPRVGFFGTVSLDGSPLKNGFLYLEPLDRQPTQSYAVINDGLFKVSASAGAVPGRYRVSIVRDDSSQLPDGVDPQTPEGAAIADKLSRETKTKQLHPSYNVQSKLEAELKDDGKNELQFELKSNPDEK